MRFPAYKFRGRLMASRQKVLHIGDLTDPDLMLVTDSQDVKAIKENVPGANDPDFDGFFVKIKDGDYSEVYGFAGTVPYNYKEVLRIV